MHSAGAAGSTAILLPSAQFATDAYYLQQGDDPMLIGEYGTKITMRGYFLLDSPPDLTAPEGGRIMPVLVGSFTPSDSVASMAAAGSTQHGFRAALST